MALARIVEQVERPRNAQLDWRIKHVLLPDEVQLPVAPLDGVKTISNKAQDRLASGLVALTSEERHEVKTVDRPILGNRGTSEGRHRREQVNGMTHLITDTTWLDMAWPPNHERNTQRALHSSEVRTTPWPAPTTPWKNVLGPVVRGDDDDRVVAGFEFVQQIQQRPDTRVDLDERVCKVAVSRCSDEVGVRQCREVRERNG